MDCEGQRPVGTERAGFSEEAVVLRSGAAPPVAPVR